MPVGKCVMQHSGVGRVDALATMARGVVDVDAQVPFVDFDLNVIGQNRQNLDTTEGGLTALLGIRRANAYETVHTLLALEHAVGVMPTHGEGRTVEADSLAGRGVVDSDLPVLALGVTRVHAEEHLGPVLGLKSALARIDRHDTVTGVELVVEPRGQLERVGIGRKRSDGLDDLRPQARRHPPSQASFGRLGILEKRDGVVVLRDFVTQRRGLAHD